MTHRRWSLPRRGAIILTSLALLLCGAIGGTLAWLVTSTGSLTNTFTPAQVQCEVVETFVDKTTKSNVYVSNPDLSENVPAYIRVALVPTWEDGNRNTVALPASLADLTITWNLTDWVKIGDYYYFKTPVDPGKETKELIYSATVKTPNGYQMNLHVLAEAIQAEGKDSAGKSPVETVWDVKLTDGKITGGGGVK